MMPSIKFFVAEGIHIKWRVYIYCRSMRLPTFFMSWEYFSFSIASRVFSCALYNACQSNSNSSRFFIVSSALLSSFFVGSLLTFFSLNCVMTPIISPFRTYDEIRPHFPSVWLSKEVLLNSAVKSWFLWFSFFRSSSIPRSMDTIFEREITSEMW